MIWAAAIGAALSIAGKVMDNNSQNAAWAAQETARRKQLIQMVRQSNTQDANLRLQDRSNFEAARQELENATLDSVKAQGTLQVAMAESGLEGRSMDKVKRDTENVYLRTKGMINTNYERDYANIYAQRAASRDELIAAVEGSQPIPKQSGASQMLGLAMAGGQGAIAGSNLWGAISQTSTVASASNTASSAARNIR